MKIPTLQELLEAGVHFGHKVSRGNPRMGPFIYGAREGVAIIDLTKVEKYLKEACEFAKELGKMRKTLLFVGTKKQARDIVLEAAQKVGAPYFVNKWVGGFLTNFEEISKNISKLRELKEQKEKGELAKYTKKEQLLLDRKILELTRNFGGVENLLASRSEFTLPDAIFVLDAQKDALAIKEASRTGVKIIAVLDSNADPTLVDYPIPGNDDAIKSIKILVSAVTDAFGEGLKEKLEVRSDPSTSLGTGKMDEEVGKSKLAGKKEGEEILPEEVVEEVAEAEEKVEKEALVEADRKI